MVWGYVILTFLTFCYILISVLLIIGVSRLKKSEGYKTQDTRHCRGIREEAPTPDAYSLIPDSVLSLESKDADLPFVSVLVAARDEERNIADCLESLVRQQYPSDRYEIVVVNDRSNDSTPSIIKSYMEEHEMVKCIDIDSNTSGLTGKQNALNEGLKFCTGEIIMNTDADCIAGPLWVHRTVSHFGPGVGITIGFSTTFSAARYHCSGETRRPPLFADLQSLDMLFLIDAAAGAIGMNVPVSCLGRNLAYRKFILDDIDYPGMEYTITEDAALVQAVARDTDWDISVVYDKGAVVSTLAEESVKQFLSQRIRWILGGRATRSWTQIPLHAIFLFHLCLAISFPLMFFVRSFPITLFSILIKATLDFIRCWRVCKAFDRTDLLKLFLPYEVFMVFYSALTGLSSIFIREIRWKGEAHTSNARHAHSAQ